MLKKTSGASYRRIVETWVGYLPFEWVVGGGRISEGKTYRGFGGMSSHERIEGTENSRSRKIGCESGNLY